MRLSGYEHRDDNWKKNNQEARHEQGLVLRTQKAARKMAYESSKAAEVSAKHATTRRRRDEKAAALAAIAMARDSRRAQIMSRRIAAENVNAQTLRSTSMADKAKLAAAAAVALAELEKEFKRSQTQSGPRR